MISNLLYVIASTPYIMQEIRLVARFQTAPKETHVQAMEGTLDFCLWYLTCKYFTLIAYTNVDWEGRVDDRKSTSGGAFFLGNYLI